MNPLTTYPVSISEPGERRDVREAHPRQGGEDEQDEQVERHAALPSAVRHEVAARVGQLHAAVHEDSPCQLYLEAAQPEPGAA